MIFFKIPLTSQVPDMIGDWTCYKEYTIWNDSDW